MSAIGDASRERREARKSRQLVHALQNLVFDTFQFVVSPYLLCVECYRDVELLNRCVYPMTIVILHSCVRRLSQICETALMTHSHLLNVRRAS